MMKIIFHHIFIYNRSMIQTLADKAKSLSDNANATNKTSESAEKYVGNLQTPLAAQPQTPGLFPTIGSDTNDNDATTELEDNTANMVSESKNKMDIILNDDTCKIDESIAKSLLTYIVTDGDDAKYKLMEKSKSET